MEDTKKWSEQTQEQQQTRMRNLNQDERQCRSYLTLARETVDMFHYLTQDIKEPFLRPELVDRLAAMLNFNLKQLSGSKCKNLKVRNPEKYNWDPKWLLSHLVDIYIHLDSEVLAAALANDQRSFSMETFQDAVTRIQKNLSMSPSDVEKFKALAEKAQQITIDNLKKDEDFEDAPDDFLGKQNLLFKKWSQGDAVVRILCFSAYVQITVFPNQIIFFFQFLLMFWST